MDRKKMVICFIFTLFLNSFCFAGKWKMSAPGVDNPMNVFFTSSQNGVVTGAALNGNLPGPPIRWTNDGGKKWHGAKIESTIKDLQSYNLTGLWFSNSNVGWVAGSGWIPVKGTKSKTVLKSILLKTIDGGKTWKSQNLPGDITNNSNVYRVWFGRKGKKGWLAGYGGSIWKTENGGRTWQKVTVPENAGPAFYAVSFSNIVIGGHNVYITKDAGKTWRTISLHLESNGSVYAISFAPDGKVGWAIGQEGKQIQNGGWGQLKTQFVFKTVDEGKTWTREKLPVKKLGFLTDVCAISSQDAWLSSFYGYAWPNIRSAPPRLFQTTDGGKIWKDKTEYLISIRKLFFLNPREGWAVGGQGGSPYEPPMAILIYHGKQ